MDERGAFAIDGLDPELLFTILVLAEGFTPQYVKRVDPLKGEIIVRVSTIAPAPDEPRRVLRGRILDDRGEPVPGAVVSAGSIHHDDGRGMFGSIPGLDAYAISDSKGCFRICHKEPVDAIGVEIRAPGLAPRSAKLRTGGKVREVHLDPGATVSGRLLLGKRGLPGVVVGLVQINRNAESFLGETTIATDGEGRFTFNNVARGQNYVVYGKMASIRSHGASPVRRLNIAESRVDAGDIVLVKGHRVRGLVRTTDGKPLPEGVRILLSADVAWDSQLVVLDEHGRFEIPGIPSGLFSLTVRVPGYRMSARNRSRRPSWPTALEGRIENSLDNLLIELEPGNPERAKWSRELHAHAQKLKQEPLQGAPPADPKK